MSRVKPSMVLLLGVCAVLATGCGSAPAATGAAPSTSAGSPSHGDHLPPGPSALTVMVCGPDVSGDVAEIVGRRTVPVTPPTWVDRLYTCTFRLPVGPLVLSVKESEDAAAARGHYAATRERLPATRDTPGLGERAYRSPDGIVGLVKDNFTLTVDATGLPAEFGAQRQKRTDLAYEVATVVMGCWTGHG